MSLFSFASMNIAPWKRLLKRRCPPAQLRLPASSPGTSSLPIELSSDEDTALELSQRPTARKDKDHQSRTNQLLDHSTDLLNRFTAAAVKRETDDKEELSESDGEDGYTADEDPWRCIAHPEDCPNHGAYPAKPLENLPFDSPKTGVWIGNFNHHDQRVQCMPSYNDLIKRFLRKKSLNGVQTYPDTAKPYMKSTSYFAFCRGERCFDENGDGTAVNDMLCLETLPCAGGKVVIFPFHAREPSGEKAKLFAIVYREKKEDWRFFKAEGGYADCYSLVKTFEEYNAEGTRKYLQMQNEPDPDRHFEQYSEIYSDDEYEQDQPVKKARRPNTRNHRVGPLAGLLPRNYQDAYHTESASGKVSYAKPPQTRTSQRTQSIYRPSTSTFPSTSAKQKCISPGCETDDEEMPLLRLKLLKREATADLPQTNTTQKKAVLQPAKKPRLIVKLAVPSLFTKPEVDTRTNVTTAQSLRKRPRSEDTPENDFPEQEVEGLHPNNRPDTKRIRTQKEQSEMVSIKPEVKDCRARRSASAALSLRTKAPSISPTPVPPALSPPVPTVEENSTVSEFDRVLKSILAFEPKAMTDLKVVALFRDVGIAAKEGIPAQVCEIEAEIWKPVLAPP